jgi:hypothetical protein
MGGNDFHGFVLSIRVFAAGSTTLAQKAIVGKWFFDIG